MPANTAALRQLKENWGWLMALGIAMLIIGTLAIIFSFTSTIISVIYFGALLLTAGIMEGIKSTRVSQWSTFFLHLFLSILYIVGGIFIMIHPAVNAITLTLVLAIFFVISGILRMIFSLGRQLPHRSWLFISGILTLLLGILIWQQWPYSGLWVLGTFLGIDLIFTGWTWIMLSMAAKEMKV